MFNRLDMIIEFRMKRCEMKKPVYCAIILIASTVLLSCTHALAYAHDSTISGDVNGDMVVSESELASSILAYLNGSTGRLTFEQLRESANIHAH